MKITLPGMTRAMEVKVIRAVYDCTDLGLVAVDTAVKARVLVVAGQQAIVLLMFLTTMGLDVTVEK